MKDYQTIDSLFKKAVELHQSSQFDKAVDIYSQVLKLNPDHFDALQLLATLHAHSARFALSAEIFAKAVKINDKNPKVLNNYGYVLAQIGDPITAQLMYERAVKLDPNYLDALNNLANLHQHLGNFEIAIELYERTIKLNSSYTQAYFNKGVALQKIAKFPESLASYEQVIKLKPDYFDAYLNKAVVLKEMGELEQALKLNFDLLNHITAPQSFEIHNNCGNLLQSMGKFDNALAQFDQAVLANPYQAVTYSNRGNVLQRLQRYPEAVLSYEVALTINPKNADFYSNRGNAHQSMGSLELALKDYESAIEFNPDHPQAYYNMGNLFKLRREYESAIYAYNKAIWLEPLYSDAFNNLGNIYKDQNQLISAIKAYDLAIESNPLHLDATNNKGVALQRLEDFEGARDCFEKAISLNPQSSKGYVNKAIILFLQGKLLEAWPLYEKRLGGIEMVPRPFVSAKPQLCHTFGSSLNDKTLLSKSRVLVWSEQGVGDIVMYASMFKRLSLLVKGLIVLIDKRLIPLFQRSFSNVTFVDKDLEVDPATYDVHIPVASIGYFLEMDESKIKTLDQPYLVADEAQARAIKNQLERLLKPRPNELPRSINCGISWHSQNPRNGEERTLDAHLLMRSLKIEGVNFINLQYALPSSDTGPIPQTHYLDRLKEEGLVTTDVDNFTELDRLAALISNCDLVISVDNSTVHLSAALGVPTWILLPLVPDWRWMLGRADSPWYPCVQLFRQKIWGDWSSAIHEIKTELEAFVSLKCNKFD